MTDAMYELPSDKSQKSFTVTLPYAKEKIEKSKYAYLKVA
jgi:ATP-dependent Clp protease ATP-binding subunit ClpX